MARPGRSLILVTIGLFVVLWIWTAVIAAVDNSFLTFVVGWPRARLSPESVGMVVSVVTAFLVYLRYSVSGSPRFLFIALAFVVLGFSQVVLGASIGESGGLVPQEDLYLWMAGRILAAVLLFVGATRQPQESAPGRGSAVRFLVATAVVVAVVGAVDVILLSLEDRLPALTTATVQMATAAQGVLPGLTMVDLLMGSAGAALYFIAAWLYLRPLDRPPPEATWLAPGLIIAGFSHLHYMLFPVILLDRLSTGDLLRILFAAVLLAGVAWEVRRTALSERDRAAELEGSYAREQVRVQELEETERTKAELFRVLTHELAHPVATLRGFVVSLISRWDELDDTTRIRALQRMDDESKRLRDLAEEVVSVSQLDSPGFSVVLRREPVRELVRETLGAAGGLEGHVEATMDEDAGSAVLLIDRARILQVFRNLLSNAQKYSPDGAPVGVSVTLDDDEVVFSVSDQGPGIPVEDIPRLFHQFVRLHRPGEDDIGGSGLGLYISRRIVEAHQGRIWAESEPGRGSVFKVALPRTEDGS